MLKVCTDAAMSSCSYWEPGIGVTQQSVSASSLGTGTRYWAARAIGVDESVGWGPYSASRWVSISSAASPPPTPVGVGGFYLPSGPYNYIYWSASSGATSYVLYWGTSPSVSTSSMTLGPTSTTSFAHTGVVSGYTYYYRVAAINSSGQSALSSTVSITVP